MLHNSSISELRQDLVTGDWVVIATGRADRPHAFKSKPRAKFAQSQENCPFEDPQKSGNGEPLFIAPAENWFVQAISNKFPALGAGECSLEHREGPYVWRDGVGRHEVFVYRDHFRPFADFSDRESRLALEAFRERYRMLREEDCVEYVSLFHNHGREAGASIAHPHSQLIATPVIPPQVAQSLLGSRRYFTEQKRCVHCAVIEFERADKKRIVLESDRFIAFCPFASRSAFEVRVFPKEHQMSFGRIDDKESALAAKMLRDILKKIAAGLGDPALNFFIHTTPTHGEHFEYYHWHIEIIPKTSIWAGFEISTGIEISAVSPETAAEYLRSL
jgi:UDPglucose--hexose-1-phosphate uridylyltransferase